MGLWLGSRRMSEDCAFWVGVLAMVFGFTRYAEKETIRKEKLWILSLIWKVGLLHIQTFG